MKEIISCVLFIFLLSQSKISLTVAVKPGSRSASAIVSSDFQHGDVVSAFVDGHGFCLGIDDPYG